MKVVLFCGGLGLRLREVSDTLPKPMVPIGDTPVLLHVMRYYAHYGHTDFVLCLGYKGDVIRNYFLERGAVPRVDDERQLSNGQVTETVTWRGWTVTFAPTGDTANIGSRLRCVQPLVENEEMFLANYSDDLTDAPLDELIANFRQRPGLLGGFLSVRPNLSFHCVIAEPGGSVTDIIAIRDTAIRVNGGYFLLRPGIFPLMHPGEELVEQPFERLIQRRALWAYAHDGFWGPLDTLKDHQLLEELNASGAAPWKVWERSAVPRAEFAASAGAAD